jgi:hypothetical protein
VAELLEGVDVLADRERAADPPGEPGMALGVVGERRSSIQYGASGWEVARYSARS